MPAKVEFEKLTAHEIRKTKAALARRTRIVWMVEKFVPDHCPTCGGKFIDMPNSLFVNGETGRRYEFDGLFKVVVCPKCRARTALVEIEERYVRTKREALRILRAGKFTLIWPYRTNAEDERFYLKLARKLHPLGLGLLPHAAKPKRTTAPLTAGTPATEY